MVDSEDLLPLKMVRQQGIPSMAQCHRLHKIMERNEYELQTILPARIAEARAVLDALLARAAEVAKVHRACQSLLAPIRCLPPEVLAQIFPHCLPDEPFISPARSKSPLILTQVCSTWRTIALSTPHLWNRLRVTFKKSIRGATSNSKDMDRIVAPLMNLWLSRSGSLPLYISIEAMRLKQSIIDVLYSYSSRCRQLSFSHIYSWAQCIIPHSDFPDLEDLHVHSLVGVTPSFLSSLRNCTSLRNVLWEDNTWYDFDERLSLPLRLNQLTRMTLGKGNGMGIHAAMILEILSECSNLEYASVTFWNSPINVPPRAPIQLSKLSTLALHAQHHGIDDHSPFFQYLELPKLSNLECASGTQWPTEDFASFISRSSCSITHLRIRQIPLTTSHLEDALQVLSSSLRSLIIYDHGSPIMSDHLLRRLTPDATGDCLCPKLELLGLVGCISQTPGALVGMVRGRLQSPRTELIATLKHVAILWSEVDLEELMTLRKYGLIVVSMNGHMSDI